MSVRDIILAAPTHCRMKPLTKLFRSDASLLHVRVQTDRVTEMSKQIRKTRTAVLFSLFSCLCLAVSLVAPQSAIADAIGTRHYLPHYFYPLPPERHVVEGVRPPWSNRFLINGRYFAATSPACANWLPGDRIKLLAGDWHGYCEVAVFRNLRRHSTCTMQC